MSTLRRPYDVSSQGMQNMGAIASRAFLLVIIGLHFFILRRAIQNNRRNREELYKTFESTMQQHGIRTFEILKESI